MEGRRSLHGALGVTVAARSVTEGKLEYTRVGVQRSLHLLGLFAIGSEAGLVFRGEDFCASQIVFGVNVLRLICLLLARALLACGCGSILRLLRAAVNRAKQQARAENNAEAAAKRLSERHWRMRVMLVGTAEICIHFRPTLREHPMPEYY
jgi:hypothetical protein